MSGGSSYLRVSGRRNIYPDHTHHTVVQDELHVVSTAAETRMSPPPERDQRRVDAGVAIIR